MIIKLVRKSVQQNAPKHSIKMLEIGQPIQLMHGISLACFASINHATNTNAQQIDSTNSKPLIRFVLSDGAHQREFLISPNQTLDLRDWNGLVIYPLAVGLSQFTPFLVQTLFIRIDDWGNPASNINHNRG